MCIGTTSHAASHETERELYGTANGPRRLCIPISMRCTPIVRCSSHAIMSVSALIIRIIVNYNTNHHTNEQRSSRQLESKRASGLGATINAYLDKEITIIWA